MISDSIAASPVVPTAAVVWELSGLAATSAAEVLLISLIFAATAIATKYSGFCIPYPHLITSLYFKYLYSSKYLFICCKFLL